MASNICIKAASKHHLPNFQKGQTCILMAYSVASEYLTLKIFSSEEDESGKVSKNIWGKLEISSVKKRKMEGGRRP